MRLISIDPGARSGLALWSPDKAHAANAPAVDVGGLYLEQWAFAALPPEGRSYYSVAMEHLEEWGVGAGDVVIVEGQWAIDRRSRRRPRRKNASRVAPWDSAEQYVASGRDVAELVDRRCGWQYAAEQLTGQATEVIQPSAWMSMARDCPGAKPGERVRWLVGEALGVRTNLDEAAAIGLGMWWLRRRREV